MVVVPGEEGLFFPRVTSPFEPGGACLGDIVLGNGCMLCCVCRVEESQHSPVVIEIVLFCFFFVPRVHKDTAP